MSAARHQPLQPLWLIGAVAAVVVALYAESFATMWRLWGHSSHAHGLAVLPIAAYLLWRLRDELTAVRLAPWPPAVAALAALAGLWALSRLVGVQAMEHLAAIAMIPAAVAACLGRELAARAVFPFFFLLMAVPFGDALVPYLMRITADIASGLLFVAGVPVFRDGQLMVLPGGSFEVADVCSGLEYLKAGLMLSLLFAYVGYTSLRKRIVFVAVTVGAVIAANGARAFLVMWIASGTEMRVMGGRDHVYFGWLFFALVIGILFWVASRWSDEPDSSGRMATRQQVRVSWPVLIAVLALVMLAVTAPFAAERGNRLWVVLPAALLVSWLVGGAFARAMGGGAAAGLDAYRQRGGAAALLLAAVLLAAAPASLRLLTVQAEPLRGAHLSLPNVARCAPPGPWSGVWRPRLASVGIEASGTYACGETAVSVRVAGFHDDAVRLASTEHPLGLEGAPGRSVRRARTTLSTASGRRIVLNEIEVHDRGRARLIWYWYAVGERTARTRAAVKALQALQVLSGQPVGGMTVIMEAALDEPGAAGRARLAEVANAIDALLTGTGDSGP